MEYGQHTEILQAYETLRQNTVLRIFRVKNFRKRKRKLLSRPRQALHSMKYQKRLMFIAFEILRASYQSIVLDKETEMYNSALSGILLYKKT